MTRLLLLLLLFPSVASAALVDSNGTPVTTSAGQVWESAYEAVSTPQMLAACSVVDVGTTVYAVSAGIGREVNPILSGSVNAHHWWKLILTKAAFVGVVWYIYDKWQEQSKAGVAAASVLTCGVAANNALMILKSTRP